ncbi:hypothetical protein KK083_20280 [Fulvivirgaceae bacterium PWU4]|uniref:Uncharacterized protein n=1 Tax=Chryseosolibacter histidini TaxID=2782349 RepID=A0AAP2GKE7_9BACT|nr:hypothetical protein [Chryseosolibacter histidini]MBT1699246.1 hypothetical protein [Chryseosolibacter histidini]
MYKIKIDKELYKIGKADLNRTTASTGLPTRLHQQLRKLQALNAKKAVEGKVVKDLGNTTTKKAKKAETAELQKEFDKTGKVPDGNKKSFKPN